jgi:hypothetical protein
MKTFLDWSAYDTYGIGDTDGIGDALRPVAIFMHLNSRLGAPTQQRL